MGALNLQPDRNSRNTLSNTVQGCFRDFPITFPVCVSLCVCLFSFQYLQTLHLQSCDLLDVFGGISFFPLDKMTYLKIQSFVNRVEESLSLIKYTAFLYNDQLIWYRLNACWNLYLYLIQPNKFTALYTTITTRRHLENTVHGIIFWFCTPSGCVVKVKSCNVVSVVGPAGADWNKTTWGSCTSTWPPLCSPDTLNQRWGGVGAQEPRKIIDEGRMGDLCVKWRKKDGIVNFLLHDSPGADSMCSVLLPDEESTVN